ncbi:MULTISPECIES: hypothetical protein [unclassified Nocardia]|uniref:hypothetical protein n=1 Tax=unclassified Nocardia TaxID=2637762 RepID=UPI00278C5FEE|nr:MULTISPECIES: hypothetical protein [unclassified Nocardia]
MTAPASRPEPKLHDLIAYIAAIRAAAAAGEKALKQQMAREEETGTTRIATSTRRTEDGRRVRLGAVRVAEGRTEFSIEPSEAAPYLAERFGVDVSEVVELVPQLTPQYANSLLAEAKEAKKLGEPLPPGVTVKTGDPVVSWSAEKGVDVVAEIAAMVARGDIDLPAVLGVARPALEGPTQ